MHALFEIYRRYFRSHIVGILLACVCCVAVAGEASVMAYITRYLVDEVLEVQLSDQVITHGQAGQFVSLDEPLSKLPDDQSVCIEQLVDGELPGEGLVESIITADLAIDGGLQDRIAAKPGRSSAEQLRLLGLVAIALVGTHVISIGISTWSSIKLGIVSEQVVYVMRRHIHDKLLRLQLSFHDQYQTGRLLSRAVDDIQVVEGSSGAVLMNLARFVALISINVTIMCCISGTLAAISLFAMPFYAATYLKLAGRIRDMSRVQRKQRAGLYGLVRDRLANPRVVKGFGQERREVKEFFRGAKGLFR